MVDQRRIDDQRWLDAATASKHLGIQLRSLYAYVSRGQIRSVPGEHGRPRLYALADLERLRVRRDARSGHGAVAAGALRWGEPVLDSAITAITTRGPAYRGQLATELAEAETPFENVAELLWSGVLPPSRVRWPRAVAPLEGIAALFTAGPRAASRMLAGLISDAATPVDVMPLVVQLAALADPERHDPRPDAFLARGRIVIPLLAASLAPGFTAAGVTRALGADTVAGIAARALGLAEAAIPILDHVFVLLADHELNASSFTARIAASTEADPYACIAAALATLSGARHGRASAEVARFADEVGGAPHAKAAVRALRKRGELPPGFGHPLYAAGDPRAAPLLAVAEQLAGPRAVRAKTLFAVAKATTEAHANVDLALAALVSALGASPAAGPGLFAVARSAGWLAHAIEQRAAGGVLRPRARYTGVPVS